MNRPAQEHLLRALLEELEGPADHDAEQVWLAAVQRRSAEFDAGWNKTIPAAAVFETHARINP